MPASHNTKATAKLLAERYLGTPEGRIAFHKRRQANADRPLTYPQRLFIAALLRGVPADEAVRESGSRATKPKMMAAQWLRRANVKAELARRKTEMMQAAALSPTRVLEELRRIAFMDPRGLFDEGGNLKPIREWTSDQAAALAHFEVVKANASAGDGHTDTIHRIRLVDKMKALEMLAKHFTLLVERVEISASDGLMAKLAAARTRVIDVTPSAEPPALPATDPQ